MAGAGVPTSRLGLLGVLLSWALPGSAGQAVAGVARAQRFAVELDKPPAERWDEIAPQFRDAYIAATTALSAKASTHLAVEAVAHVLHAAPALAARLYPGELMGEFESIARAFNLTAEHVAANALLYDLTAAARPGNASARACTSVVAQTASGVLIHGRNLDYGSADELKRLSILVDFQRAGAVLYTATTFVGMPVFNTVQKAGGCARDAPWSLSQNERDQGDIRLNWLRLLTGTTPSTFAQIRRVADGACSYGEALGLVSALPLPAPSYFVLAGSRPGEGAVVARDRDAPVDVWRLPARPGPGPGNDWFVLETNYDRTAQPAPHDRRRAVAERFLRRYAARNFTQQAMWLLLSDRRANASAGERGIWNNETIFSQVMVQGPPPAQPTLRFQVRGAFPGLAPLTDGGAAIM